MKSGDQFVEKVKAMRKAQVAFSESRKKGAGRNLNPELLKTSKRLEKEVDEYIEMIGTMYSIGQ